MRDFGPNGPSGELRATNWFVTTQSAPQRAKREPTPPPGSLDKLLATLAPLIATVLGEHPDERTRRLPKAQTLLLCVAMSVFRALSLDDLIRKLKLALPGSNGALGVASSSVTEARERLGVDPAIALFREVTKQVRAETSAATSTWRGLLELAVDGTTFRLPDVPALRAYFGAHTGPTGTPAAFPSLRLVVAMAIRSHVLVAAAIGGYPVGELTLAAQLLSGLPERSLLLLDRGFVSMALLYNIHRHGGKRHWLTRIKKTTRYKKVRRLGPGDDEVEVTFSDEARKADPTLPLTMAARVLRVDCRGYRPFWVMTSMLDTNEFPAEDVRARYVGRWHVELGYREMKSGLLAHSPTLRSRTVEGVKQEMWAMLVGYQCIRGNVQQAAHALGLDGCRVSFLSALRMWQSAWVVKAWHPDEAVPKEMAQAWRRLEGMKLPAPRRGRRCPRVVRIRHNKFPHKAKYRPLSKKTRQAAKRRNPRFSQTSVP